MKIRLKIENVYPSDDSVVTTFEDIDVADEIDLNDQTDYAALADNIFAVTGSGLPGEPAGYFVEIVDCDEDIDIVGRVFEFV